MATYVYLLNWTEQGIRNVKDAVTREQAAKANVERSGGKWVGAYYTQGIYDVVVILEFPDDETASTASLALAMQGNVRSVTMRAFTVDELGAILQKLP